MTPINLYPTFDPAAHKTYSLFPGTSRTTNLPPLLILVRTLSVGGGWYKVSAQSHIGYLAHWLKLKYTSYIKGIALILALRINSTSSTNVTEQPPYTFLITVSPVFKITLCLTTRSWVVVFTLIYTPTHFLAVLVPLRGPQMMTPIDITAELIKNLAWPPLYCVGFIINIAPGHSHLKPAVTFFDKGSASLSGPTTAILILVFFNSLLIFFEVLITLPQFYIYCFFLLLLLQVTSLRY